MIKKIGKGLLTLGYLIMGAILGILEIVVEVIFQTVRLGRRGFRYCMNGFIKFSEKVYDGRVKLEPKQRVDKDTIKYYEFVYED